jgi:hypothetical protein
VADGTWVDVAVVVGAKVAVGAWVLAGVAVAVDVLEGGVLVFGGEGVCVSVGGIGVEDGVAGLSVGVDVGSKVSEGSGEFAAVAP